MRGLRSLAQQATTWGLDPAHIVGVTDPIAAWVVRELAAWARAYPDGQAKDQISGKGGKLPPGSFQKGRR